MNVETLSQNLKQTLSKVGLKSNERWHYAAYICLGIAAILTSLVTQNNAEQGLVKSTALANKVASSADTYIPEGHVLIPIDLANAQGINSIIGPLGGTVDLYVAGQGGKKGQLVGRKYKLLRAPLDPEQFAVLLKENNSEELLQHEGAFIAVIHNPKVLGNQATVERTAKPRQYTIEYQEGS